jgi:hypothetical protein
VLVGGGDLGGHRVGGQAMDARRQTLRDRGCAGHRVARELDRVVRELDQGARRRGTEALEQRVLCDLPLEHRALAIVDHAIGVHRADHRFDQKPARIVGAKAASQQILDGALGHGR